MEPLTRKKRGGGEGGGMDGAKCTGGTKDMAGMNHTDGGNGIGENGGAAGRNDQRKRGLRLRIRDLPLRSYFLLVVFTVFGGVVLLSGLTIWGCSAFRRYLLPDPDAAYLTVEEVRADGTVTEMTTWLDFGEATKLPQIKEEESIDVEEEGAGGLGPDSEQTVQDGASGMEDEPEGSGQVGADDLETAEMDVGWQGDQHTMREAGHGEVVDATYSIQKIEKSFDALTPKRKLAYRFCGAAMVAVPAALSVGGILFAGFFFYRRRLKEPLAILSRATEQIAAQDLDFSIEYPCGDEMGALCESFERMREELARNNKAMWRLLDQRRLMQASIAHDLRNPIAIIQGYAEYLQMHLPAGDLSPGKTARIASNLKSAAMRLEQYTESVRVLNRLEDMEPDRREVEAVELMEEVRDDLRVMADRAGVALHIEEGYSMEGRRSVEQRHSMEEERSMEERHPGDKPLTERLMVDKAMFFRILENVFENAVRFSRSQVSVRLERKDGGLAVTVADDGPGFPEELLKKRGKALLPTRQEDGHLGMGLAISRVLCEKHGGSLHLGNRTPQGAVVKIFLAV